MSKRDPRKFYISLEKKSDGTFRKLKVSMGLPDDEEIAKEPEAKTPQAEEKQDQKSEFANVLKTFQSALDGYRDFIPLTLWMAPHLAHQIGFNNISSLAERRGSKLVERCSDNTTVFELDMEYYNECSVLTNNLNVAIGGAKHLPEVMLIGLVSVYDAMLSRLLNVVFRKREEIVLTSEKTIKLSELSSLGSIEAAKTAIIDKEVEAALRDSHHKQFAWLENKFKIKLREGLHIWPTFVEVCERRNLITHTGGCVTAQYLASGEENKFDLSGISLGQKLEVDGKYYEAAVNAVYEVGAKLCHVFWRKFSEKERKEADNALNNLGYALIRDRNYKLAEAILQFGANLRKHDNDMMRRMMIVNLANAVRLQKRPDDANVILDKEDWSAVGDDFKICVSAVKGDIDEVVRLMLAMGRSGPVAIEDYRNWPVFRGMRTKEKFSEAFEKVFESRLLIQRKELVETTKEPPVDVPVH